MKIESGRGVAQASGAKRAGAGSAAPGFSPNVDAPERTVAATATGAVASLDVILALQGEEPPAQRRARQAKRGSDALDTLEKLEQGLLVGRAPGALKAELERLQFAGEATGDPRLDDILREIDIRLAVEAAKLERVLGRA
jgi:hypothetical protein